MTRLKAYTQYRCPDCGKSSIWTGAYTNPDPGDGVCGACGAEMVEEVDDGRRWKVSFEIVHPSRHPELYDGERVRPGVFAGDLDESCWTPVSREDSSEHSVRRQYEGLLSQIGEGELIRNVRLEVSHVVWEFVAGGESS